MADRILLNVLRAIFSGDTDKLDSLVNGGFDIHMTAEGDKWNLLHQALVPVEREAHPSMIQHLIDLGIDFNARDHFLNTPLHYAARAKNGKVVEVLLKAGAEVDPTNDEGMTPLHLSLTKFPLNVETAKVLLAHGANPDYGTGALRRYIVACADPSAQEILTLFDSIRR